MVIDCCVMTGSSYAYYVCVTRPLVIAALCNCRVGMTYVWIVPSFITDSLLLATNSEQGGRIGELATSFIHGETSSCIPCHWALNSSPVTEL